MAFSPDGKTIVSGSLDKTLKVWEVRPFLESEWEEVDISGMPKDSDGDVELDGWYTKNNYWRNKVTGSNEKQKPNGGKRRPLNRSKSGIQVRNRQKRPLPVKSDLLRPPTQPRWS